MDQGQTKRPPSRPAPSLTEEEQKEPDRKQLPLFPAGELMPLVSAHYRGSDDATHIGIGGTSVGAFVVLYVALHRPDLFVLVLAESPDLWLRNGQPPWILPRSCEINDLSDLMEDKWPEICMCAILRTISLPA
jgi:S-formylglutathione hydrolase FrmB